MANTHISRGSGSGTAGAGIQWDPSTDSLSVVGSYDAVRLLLKSNATQTANLLEARSSSGTLLTYLDPSGFLRTMQTFTSPTAPVKLIDVSPTISLSAANSQPIYSLFSGITLPAGSGNNYNGQISAVNFDFTKSGGATASNILASAVNVIQSGSGTISTLTMYGGVVNKPGTGPITTAYFYRAQMDNNNAAGTIGTAYLFFGKKPTVTGAITTLYGLYLEDMSVGTTSYAIYTNAGKVRIGDTLQYVPGAASGYVLTSDASGNASWTAPSAASVLATRAVTVSGNVTAADYMVRADATAGPVTLTPSSLATGQLLAVKKSDASGNQVILSGTVDGVTNPAISTQYGTLLVQWNGSSFDKISQI